MQGKQTTDAFVIHISPEYIIKVVCHSFENKSGGKTAGSKETSHVYISQQEGAQCSRQD